MALSQIYANKSQARIPNKMINNTFLGSLYNGIRERRVNLRCCFDRALKFL